MTQLTLTPPVGGIKNAESGDDGIRAAANRSAAATAAAQIADARWIVLFSGDTATDDYAPSASEGEPAALVREVTDICVAFHPHSEIRRFPHEREALLFWKARTTGDWIVTRVTTAPNPAGERTKLEYNSLAFSDRDFARLGCNPFAPGLLGLHNRVREQFLSRKSAPIPYAVPDEAVMRGIAATAGAGLPTGGGARGDVPALSSDRLSTPKNFNALRAFCSRIDDPPTRTTPLPPTFASWWRSSGDPPDGYFEIVLRAPSERILTVREASDMAVALAADIKAALPGTSADSDTVVAELERSVVQAAGGAQRSIAEAVDHSDSGSPEPFRTSLLEAARQMTQAAADLRALASRKTSATSGGSRAAAARSAAQTAETLNRLADRCAEMAANLPRVRHPNPFANRAANSGGIDTPSASLTGTAGAPGRHGQSGTASVSTNSAAAKFLAPAAAAAILLGGWIIVKQAVSTHPAAHAAETTVVSRGSAVAAAPSAAAPARDPVAAILEPSQNAVLEAAKARAQRSAAKLAAEQSGLLAESDIQEITFTAIRAAYRAKLSTPQYRKAFHPTVNTSIEYPALAAAVPQMVSAVREAAAGEDARTKRQNAAGSGKTEIK